MIKTGPLGFAVMTMLLWGLWSMACEPTPVQEPGQEVSAPSEAGPAEPRAGLEPRPGPEPQAPEAAFEGRSEASSPDGSPEQRPLPEPAKPEPRPGEPSPEPPPREPPPAPTTPLLYLAQTNGKIETYEIQPQSGLLKKRFELTQAGAMRFLAFHPKKTHLYAISGDKVQAFSIAKDGRLAYLSQVKSGESGTHLEVDVSGKYVFVASYGGNQLSMVPLDGQGLPQKPTFQRGGPNNKSFCQKAHQARIHPSNRFLYVPCLGSDQIAILAFDAAAGTLKPLAPQPVKKGAGPRHMDFHPTQPWAYVLNELNSTIDVFRIQTATGALTPLQTLSNLPKGTTTSSRSSDIHVSADGRFVYAVNREALNNIAVYRVGSQGKLSLLQHVATAGNHARSFTLDALLPYLYIANAKSQSLTSFAIAADGRLRQIALAKGFSAQPWFVGILRLP